MSRYDLKSELDFEREIDELLDEALNVLSNDDYLMLLDSISIILAERGE